MCVAMDECSVLLWMSGVLLWMSGVLLWMSVVCCYG